MLESGIKPNWFGSIHSSIKGLSSRSITNPSGTLDCVDVGDMGLKSLLKSSIEAPLGTGGTSSSFLVDLTPRLKLGLVYQRTFSAPSLAGRQAPLL